MRDLWQRKGSLGALVLIGAVGLTFLICMVSVYQDLVRSRDSFYRDYRLPDFTIALKRAPDRLAKLAQQYPNVVEAEGRIKMSGRVSIEGFDDPISATVQSVPHPRATHFNELLIKSGTWFTGDGRRQVIVNEAFAEAHGLLPGDELTLVLMGQQQTFRIVARALSPEYVYVVPTGGSLAPDSKRSAVLFLPQRELAQAADLDGAFNELVGKLKDPSRGPMRASLTQLEELLEPYGVTTATPYWDAPSVQFLQSDIDGLRVSATVMPSICLVVVALVLNIVMGRLVAQQRVIIGTLKALGYNTFQIVLHYTGFGITVGLGSSLVGVWAGSWLQGVMLEIYRAVYNLPIERPGFYPEIAGSAVVIGMLFAVLGTVFGVRRAARLEPAEAMRPPPPEKGGKIFLERLPFVWALLSFRWRLVLRTIFRNPYRTSVTLGAAIVATAVMVESLSMAGAIDHLMYNEFVATARQDLTVQLREPAGKESRRELELLPGVTAVEAQLNVPCEISRGPRRRLISASGLETSDGLKKILDAEGQIIPVPSTGIVLSDKLARILGVKVGDVVVLKALIANRGETEVPVAGIANTYLGLGAYAHIEYLSRLVGEPWSANTYLLQVSPPHADALIEALQERPLVQSSDWRLTSLQNMKQVMDQGMGFMLTVIVLFSGGLAFGSVLNTALVSLSEREREVGTLRVLGYTPPQILLIFAGESILVNLVGLFFGWFAGIGLARWIVVAYDTEIFRFPAVTPPSAIYWSSFTLIFFLLLAQLLVYRFLTSMPWLDVLKIRE